MKLPEQIAVLDLLAYIDDVSRKVHIRLALTMDADKKWLGRSLVIDVFPRDWLESDSGRPKKTAFTKYNPPRMPPLLFEDHALFLRQMVSSNIVKEWLRHPVGCTLKNYDPGPDHGTKVLNFRLPEFFPDVAGQRIWSRMPDGYAQLPWPHYTYEFTLSGGNAYQYGDSQSLVKAGRHYDDFRDARGQLVHEFTDTELRTNNDRDRIAVRIIDDDGWINSVGQITERSVCG